MALTYWRDDFKTNHPQIDDEHQGTLTILKRLYQDITLNKSNAVIRATLDELFVCVLDHSETEEVLMRQYDYPDLRPHINDHEIILSSIFNLSLRVEFYDLGKSTEMVHDLVNYISIHSRTHDLNMTQYIRGQDNSFPYIVDADEPEDLVINPIS